MRSHDTWSLHGELFTVEQAIRAAMQLLASVENEPGNEQHARETARSTEAVLTLIALRLRDLGRVLRGEVDPGQLRAKHNAVLDEHDEHDVVFEARSPKHR